MLKIISSLQAFRISRKGLARALRILFFLSLIPLLAVALYNYPADDDFVCVYPVSVAWKETGSLWEMFKTAVQGTYEAYMTWQGDFFSTLLFRFTPIVFNIDWYCFDNWMMLAMVCLTIGYMVKGLIVHWMHADKWTFWIVYFAVMVLMLQFMPSISYSVFWHNGGQYTTAACTLFTLAGLALRCTQPQTKKRSLFRGVCMALAGFAMGGSFYGPALGAYVLMALWCVTMLVKKNRSRPHMLVMLAFFTAALAVSVMAPGVALRQERTGTGESVGVIVTVVTAVLDSFDLFGQWARPELFAMLLLILPTVWKPLKESGHSFRHPLWVFIMLYGLFAASLAPGIYTGYGYDTARYLNTIYFYYVIMAVGSAVYAEGALIRWLERVQGEKDYAAHLLAATKNLGSRFCALYLAVVIAFIALGGFGFTIMNTSSVSALKSLVTGEARQFHAEMKEREEYIRVTDSDVVEVKPLSVAPYVFKNDRLPWQGIYGRVRYMKWYFELFHEGE